ncbi:MAG: hypothetical protein ABI707_18175 [Ferruginibacter sp.]
MKRILIILILQIFANGITQSQSFDIDDLVNLSTLPSKNIGHFMNKKGFALFKRKLDGDTIEASFMAKIKANKDITTGPERTIDIYLRGDSKYFTFYTSSAKEYQDGRQNLIKSGFFYDDKKDISKEPSVLFQKGNVAVQATTETQNNLTQYVFKLKVKKVPSVVKYAEDLLQFDSHELLVSFFGEPNVKKDMYYLTETELRKCSVLFSGTRYQVVFVWGDENNLNNLAYVLIPHVLPTAGAEKNNGIVGNNEWQFQNGMYQGMAIKELLRLNETDFDIYGSESELAFMVKPEESGKIDFHKTAVMLSCNNCDDIKMFNKRIVSALDVAKKDLPMYVNDVIIYPSNR